MRVLVVGSGGREHALCWALAASPLLTKLWCAPGNPGTADVAENVPIGVLDIAALVAVRHATTRSIWWCPGRRRRWWPASPTRWALAGIACCGPSAAAARLEGSKSFTKEICDAAGIPTALWERFDDAHAAREFVRRRGAPIVVKADGLAAGKGVVVAASVAEAEDAIAAFMEQRHAGRGRPLRGDRGMPGRRGSQPVRPVRRHHRPAARRRAGPQAGRRRRHRPEHRRHGRLFAAARAVPGAGRGGDGAHHPPRSGRTGAPGHAVPRHPVRRADADGGRAEADRVQRPLRRPGMPGAAAAAALGPAARLAGGLRRRTRAPVASAGATRLPSPW